MIHSYLTKQIVEENTINVRTDVRIEELHLYGVIPLSYYPLSFPRPNLGPLFEVS